jgi:tRNA1(Val) A37 N6-methylase TrmN6
MRGSSDVWTRETPAPGVVVHQPQRGFRYGSEAFWLVGFALEGGAAASAADLGTGSGIAALLLAGRGIPSVGFDVRHEWEPGWRMTMRDSVTSAPVRLERRDVRGDLGGPFDLIVANPPYFPLGTGAVSPVPWKAAARTESTARLAAFVKAGLGALGPCGRLCLVLPVEREDEVLATPGAVATRRVRVGERRTLIELRAHGRPAPVDRVVEGDARARRWYALAGALS